MVNRIVSFLRKNRKIYGPLRKIYGRTVGLWWFKTWWMKNIGIWNGGKRVKLVSKETGEDLISEKIMSGKPFMLTRYGTSEFRCLFGEKDLHPLCFYSGFFPEDSKLIPKFRRLYFESSKQIDLLAVSLYKNQFLRKVRWIRMFPNIEHFLEFSSMHPIESIWIKELENKKILIVHPFKKTIEKQMKKRKELGILPELKSLEVIKAVQTIAGEKDERFKDWFEALDYMKKEIDKKDFDIALIGCGAYGLPLAAHVKRKGKRAIHVGGALQLMFGIKGKRWDEKGFYDENWVVPLEEDAPKRKDKIEGGCYW